MEFSPSQFREVQDNFLEEFELKTLDFYHQDANQKNIIHYKKIIDQLKNRKLIKHGKICKYGNPSQKSVVQSHAQKSQITQQKGISRNLYHESESQADAEEGGFYLTENIPIFKPVISFQSNVRNTAQQGASGEGLTTKCLEDIFESKEQTEQGQSCLMSTMKQVSSLQAISDKIYGQNGVFSCLKHEENQVQEAIFCFKKRIMKLQDDLSNESIREKEVQKLLVENKNQMLHAKHTNEHIRSAYFKTKKHFDLDLDGKRQIQSKMNSDNKAEFNESIANHIRMKKLKSQIHQQQQLLSELTEKRQELEKKEKKYQSIYAKERELLEVYEAIKLIPCEYHISERVSILDKDFDRKTPPHISPSNTKPEQNTISGDKVLLKMRISIINDRGYAEQNEAFDQNINNSTIKEATQNMVSCYLSLCAEMKSEVSQFEILINDRDQKVSSLMALCTRLSECECFEDNESRAETARESSQQHTEIIQRTKVLSTEIRQTQKQIRRANGFIFSFVDRLKFYVSKQFCLMKKINQTWLKHDKVASQVLQSSETKLSSTLEKVSREEMDINESKHIFVSFFEKWDKYYCYLEMIHENEILWAYLNKQRLFNFFKRIVKTKIKRQSIPTYKIFERSIETVSLESLKEQLQGISELFTVFKAMLTYFKQSTRDKTLLTVNLNSEILEKQEESPELSKLPTRNELERESHNSTISPLNKIQINRKNFRQSVELSAEQWKQFNRSSKQNIKTPHELTGESKLCKGHTIPSLKKPKPNLNIHELYEELRGEIQKVKISNW